MEDKTIVMPEEAKELYSKVELILSVIPADAGQNLKFDAVDLCTHLVRDGLSRRLGIGSFRKRDEEEDW